ncbi:MAG: hypothetical protein HYZ27_04470 [Deltaproteobacteria bacterium]|nr:hypothetical protein [Deltaproteobacteria bacterium]
MTRIGGGAPPDKPDAVRPGHAEPGPTPSEAVPKKVVDSFERAAPQITQRLEAMAGKKAAAPALQFTSEHLAEVAQAFAGLLRKNPSADRRTRAHMFAKAILRSRRFGHVFDEADEAELEKIYDLIADQLDTSPKLAQLVDEVTEGARKMIP